MPGSWGCQRLQSSIKCPCLHQPSLQARKPACRLRLSLQSSSRCLCTIASNTQHADLVQWAHSRGLPRQRVQGAVLEKALRSADDPHACCLQVALQQLGREGRGLTASEGIRKGSVLLHVPSQLLLTAEVALKQSCMADLLRKAELPDWSVLATFLLELAAGLGSGASHAWAPYIAMLPQSTGGILEWPQLQVDQYLKGSALHAEAHSIRQAADTSYRELEPMLSAAQAQGLIAASDFSPTRYSWAFSMLLSRLVRLTGLGSREALCPWADLLNHDPACSAHLDWSAEHGALVLRTDRAYAPGEQVFASYGEKTDGQLLLSYGFIPQGGNAHNACQLTIAADPHDSLHRVKGPELAKRGMDLQRSFPLRLEGWPDGMLLYAAFLAAIPADVNEMAPLADYLFTSRQFPVLDGVNTEATATDLVITCIRSSLAGYGRGLEAERQALQDLQRRLAAPGEGQEDALGLAVLQREAACAAVRIRELQILHRTLSQLQQRKSALRAGGGFRRF